MRTYLPIEPIYRDTSTTNSVSGVVTSKLSATDSQSVTGSVRALQNLLLPTSVQIGYSRTGTRYAFIAAERARAGAGELLSAPVCQEPVCQEPVAGGSFSGNSPMAPCVVMVVP